MHQIEVKPSFFRSLDRIYQWYIKIGVDPRYALRVEKEAMIAIRGLQEYPYRYKKHPLYSDSSKDIRQLLIRQYSLLFEVSPTKVDIIAIIPQRYSNQKIKSIITK